MRTSGGRIGRVWIGTSGYVYGDWRGRFYPTTLPARDWLPYYAERFPTVELNNSFYRLPTAAMFHAWHDAVPEDFQQRLARLRAGERPNARGAGRSFARGVPQTGRLR